MGTASTFAASTSSSFWNRRPSPPAATPAAEHSLRIGGASAIYHATGNIESVKRYGRWSSGAFHRYLWDSDEQHRELATQMGSDVATIHYT